MLTVSEEKGLIYLVEEEDEKPLFKVHPELGQLLLGDPDKRHLSIRGVRRERVVFWRDICNDLKKADSYNQVEFDKIQSLMLHIPTIKAEYFAALCMRDFEPLAIKIFHIYQLYLFLIDYPELKAKIYTDIEQILKTKGDKGINFFLKLYQELNKDGDLDVIQVLLLLKEHEELSKLYQSAQTENEYEGLAKRIDEVICSIYEARAKKNEEMATNFEKKDDLSAVSTLSIFKALPACQSTEQEKLDKKQVIQCALA